jgi:hypothetical protein
MKAFAYCASPFEKAVREAAGVEPLLSPPVTADNFQPEWMEGFDLLYFDLHGRYGRSVWYGDKVPALREEHIMAADLTGSVVFAASCFLGDEESPMLDAFLEAGATFVVGGKGNNFGPKRSSDYGVPLLGKWFRRFLTVFSPPKALAAAKRMAALHPLPPSAPQKGRFRAAKDDTQAFQIFERNV